MVVGVDEVGRGCLAGPVCVAAIALEDGLVDVEDSKLLSRSQRQVIARVLRRSAQLIGIGWANASYIDTYGMTAALKHAAKAALLPFGDQPELVLLDGNHNYIDDPRVVTIIDGDFSVPLISAASIIAKVARDNYMCLLARQLPMYYFDRHVGYSTQLHRQALAEYGPSLMHRMSFAPLKDLHATP